MLMSIPSPNSGSIDLGPITLRMYGFMIALGVIAAVWLMGKRFMSKGINPDHASGLAMWIVPAGIIGARVYHVITDWKRFEGNWDEAIQIWNGGLGILGGVLFGIGAAFLYCRKHDLDIKEVMDGVAPALALAQCIGRWGNYFNQELFGRPTNLPWGLEIGQRKRPIEYAAEDTFHPAFLYESLWNALVVFMLIKLGKTGRLSSGLLMVAYFAFYSIGRLWIEALRIDEASNLAGLRINIWVFTVVFIVSAVILFVGVRRNITPNQVVNSNAAE
ncbi:MAG: prolipoprotein diacylglyceryl transferase [Acidimicrobiaceae bacterium]|nr:prolipoprotein diacylglyceryl transferase [Acidimicrobiaceae bacterium]